MSKGSRHLGRYELQKHLGHGGIAEVWKAFDPQTQRHVAIKIFHTNLSDNPDFLRHFEHEAEVITALDHPDIAKTYEFKVSHPPESEHSMAYIVSDYIEGPTLSDYIHRTSRSGEFPPAEEVVALFQTINAALDYTHAHGIGHHSINPTNVRLDQHNTSQHPMGEPMLTDVGIARLLKRSAGKHSNKPHYIAPEHAQGLPGDERSDIYSLGVILYEISTGEKVFEGNTPSAIMRQHVDAAPRSPALINQHISPELEEIIMRCLAKDPAMRFASTSEMSIALAEALDAPTREDVIQPISVDETSSEPTEVISLPADDSVGEPIEVASLSAVDSMSEPAELVSPSAVDITDEPTEVVPLLPVDSTEEPKEVVLPPADAPSELTEAVPFSADDTTSEPTEVVPLSAADSMSEPAELVSPSAVDATSEPTEVVSPPAVESPPAEVLPWLPASAPPSPPPSVPPAPPAPTPVSAPASPPRRRGRDLFYIALIILLLLLLILLLLPRLTPAPTTAPGATTPATVVNQPGGHVYFLSSGQINQSTNQGIADELQIDLQNIPDPATGKSYYAWLLPDKDTGTPILIGKLPVQQGAAHLLYMGDAKHTNLLATGSRFVISEDDASAAPSAPASNTWRFYGAISQSPSSTDGLSLLTHLRYLLSGDPMLDKLGLPGGLNTWFFRNASKIEEWAGSARDGWALKYSGLIHRQAVRILDYLDGASFVQRDVPPGTPLLVDPHAAQIGLLELDQNQQPPGYLDLVKLSLNGVLQSPNLAADRARLIASITTDLDQVQTCLGQVRRDAQRLITLSDTQLLQFPSLAALNDMSAKASCAFRGQFNPSSLTFIEGVAGVYNDIQTLGAFDMAVYKP